MSFFYNLNKTLDGIAARPESAQLNERDMGKHNNATTGFKAVADKAAKEYGSKAAGERVAGAQFQKMKKAGQLEEEGLGMTDEGNAFSKAVVDAKKDGIQPGEKIRVGGKQYPVKEAGAPMTAKQQSFAALAPPTDKITFADKIAGAKKEVDEMLGDVAAEAMKQALGGGRGRNSVMDETQGATTYTVAYKDPNKPGKSYSTQVKATSAAEAKAAFEEWDKTNRFTYLGSRPDVDTVYETDRENAFTAHKRPRAETPKVGTVTHGRKHDVEEIPGGRRVTRRTDSAGISVGSDDEAAQSGEKRGRGRPKGPARAPERVTGKATKHKDGRKVKEGEDASDDIKQAMAMLKKAGYQVSKADDSTQQVDEKAVSKKQQKFMGMVHAAQKGEKPASGAVAKVAKEMPKKAAKDFAATKHKGLPEKKKPETKDKKEESVEDKPSKSSSKFKFGGSVYENLDAQLETLISEGMTISVNMATADNGQDDHSITITANGEEAMALAQLLKSAGLTPSSHQGCSACGQSECGCEQMDENSPNWPTNTETSNDALQYAGGLNKPKSTGQTTTPVLASQLRRQVSMEESAKIERNLLDLYKNFAK